MKLIRELMVSTMCMSILIILLSACGGQSNESGASEENPANAAPTMDENGIIKITVNSDDIMRYDKEVIRAVAGAKIALTLNHTGKLAKEVMGHNLVILKPATDIASFAARAFSAKENDYIPEGNDVIAHTELIGGGESTTVTFIAPGKGTYDFVCSFPGHWGLMKGKFIVE
ncbi:MAG: azurin [Bacteroidota bacterium]